MDKEGVSGGEGGAELRTCCVCKDVKPLTEFHRNRTKTKGRVYTCQACLRPRMVSYRKKNAERLKRQRATWSKNNAALLSLRKRQERQGRREQGLCRECGEYSWPYTACSKHRQISAVKCKKQRDRWRDKRACAICGISLHEEMDKGFLTCTTCRGGINS